MTEKQMTTSPIAPELPKVNWKHVTLAAIVGGFLSLIWAHYNSFVPLWLQAGNPEVNLSGFKYPGFGFGPFVTGIILVLDNTAALFIIPAVGLLSDATRTRLGRRMPWIIGAAPIAILAFVLIPVIALRLPTELSGQTDLLRPYLIPFVGVLILLLLALAVMTAPAGALAYDIAPSKNRTMVSAVRELAGGAISILGAIGAAVLFGVDPLLSFVVIAAAMLITVALTLKYIKEPEETAYLATEEGGAQNIKTVLASLRSMPKENARSLALLLSSSLFSAMVFAQLQAFLSSYSMSVLGFEASIAAIIFPIAGMAFLLGAFPAGIVGTRIGRKKTGLIGMILVLLAGVNMVVFGTAPGLYASMAVGGFAFAFVMVNINVMLIDSFPTDAAIGSAIGLALITVTLGAILGPLMGGFFVEKLFRQVDYSYFWLAYVVCAVVMLVMFLPVTKGEAKE